MSIKGVCLAKIASQVKVECMFWTDISHFVAHPIIKRQCYIGQHIGQHYETVAHPVPYCHNYRPSWIYRNGGSADRVLGGA